VYVSISKFNAEATKMAAQKRKNRQNFRNFLFENDELLKKILLSKKFLKLIKEYDVIFSEFFGTFLHFSNLAILKN